MKYYFTNNCYWDDEKQQIFRNNTIVKLTPSQIKILSFLLKHNGNMISHESLYLAMTGCEPIGEGWKASLSNQFTRNKQNEKGILIRVPEIEPFFEKSKSQFAGGYIISVPDKNIINTSNDAFINTEKYKDIWYSNGFFETQLKEVQKFEKGNISKKVKLYLQGEACSWPLIFSSSQYSPIKRSIVDELVNAIEDEVGAIALTSAGGEGKTTILMQLCKELFNSGKTVLYHAPTYKYIIPEHLTEGVILVDNPANTLEFKSFLAKSIKEGLTVVIACRSNEWITLKDTLFDDVKRSVREIEIPPISSSEAKDFAKYIKTHIFWVDRSENELERLFFKDSYGFLYASMLMALHNANSLEEIAEGIIKRISEFENGETTLKILAAIVFAEQAGTNIGTNTFRTLCRHFSIDNRNVKYYLRKEVSLNGTIYQTRHESISKLFYKYLFQDGDWWSYLNEEEREEVIIAILDVYLDKVSKSDKDYLPADRQVIETSDLLLQAFSAIEYDETQDFILQRFFESCQMHGWAIIYRFFIKSNNFSIKNTLAQKCFDHRLNIWQLYFDWFNDLSEKSKLNESFLDILRIICVDMNAPDFLWIHWAYYMTSFNNYGYVETPYSARWIFKEGSIICASSPNIWIKWANLESNLKNFGDIETPYTARWVLKEGSIQCPNNPHIWRKWANLESNLKNFGDIETPYTARWVLKEGSIQCPNNPHIWIDWANLESDLKNYGDIETPYSARWLFKEGSIQCPNNPHIWIDWANLERDLKNYGDIDTPYTARWLFKEGSIQFPNNPDIFRHWGGLECDLKNYGDIETPYTARWIFREGSIQCPNNPDICRHWGRLECDLKNYGDIETPYTARWIFKEGSIQCPNNPEIWRHWGRLERNLKNYGDIETPYTARWIFKEGSIQCPNNPEILTYWGALERDLKNYGDIETPYTARWIFKKGSIICATHSGIWAEWGKTEEENDNIGDYETINSAAWMFNKLFNIINWRDNALSSWHDYALFVLRNKKSISSIVKYPPNDYLKKKCLSNTDNDYLWIIWAIFEEAYDNIGNYSKAYSAAWLYLKTCTDHNPTKMRECWLRWAQFANRYPMHNSDGELIDAEYVMETAKNNGIDFDNLLWHELDNMKEELDYQA